MTKLEDICRQLGVPERVFKGESCFTSGMLYHQWLAAKDKAIKKILTRGGKRLFKNIAQGLAPMEPFFLFPKTKKMAMVRAKVPKYKIAWQ